MEGQRQRRALTAAESALRALAAGDAERARKAAGQGADLDQLSVYRAFAGVVRRAAGEIERDGAVCAATREALRASLGPGPLAAAVEELLGPT